MSKKSWIFAAVIMVLCLGGYAYFTWFSRVQYLRWIHERQVALKETWSKLKALDSSDREPLPGSIDDLVARGVLESGQREFIDKTNKIPVVLIYRPVPSLSGFQDVIVFVEQYDSTTQNANFVRADGVVLYTSRLTEILAEDNQRRKGLALHSTD